MGVNVAGEDQRVLGLVGLEADAAQQADVVKGDAFAGEDKDQGEEGGPGVAVVEEMEEADVETGTCGPDGEGHGLPGVRRAVDEAGIEAGPGVHADPVAFPASLGEGGQVPERRWLCGAQDVLLPSLEQLEVETGAVRRVGPQQFRCGEQALCAGGVQGAVEGADLRRRTVPRRGHRVVPSTVRGLTPGHGLTYGDPVAQVVRHGPGVVWRTDRRIVDRSTLKDPSFTNATSDEDFDRLIRNTYKVLLTRGMIGTIIYSTDPETREKLRSLVHPASEVEAPALVYASAPTPPIAGPANP